MKMLYVTRTGDRTYTDDTGRIVIVHREGVGWNIRVDGESCGFRRTLFHARVAARDLWMDDHADAA